MMVAAGEESSPTAELAASWNRNAALWSSAVREGHIASRKAATDAAILRAVLRHNPGHVLDLGCGEGWLCRALATRGVDCVGTDGSRPLVDAARSAGGGRYFHLNYAELTEDPLRAGSGFDVIVANFSLLDDRTESLVSALNRAVRPGGLLVIQTLHPLAMREEYRTGWKIERFESFGPAENWARMPWFFRTLSDWMTVFGAQWRLEQIEEPAIVHAAWPASLLITARNCDR